MIRHIRTFCLVGAALVAVNMLTACAATCTTDSKVATTEKVSAVKGESDKDAAKRDGIVRKLDIARKNLAKARLTSQHTHTTHDITLRKAEQELHIAETKFTQFEQHQAPNRLARAQLDLQNTQDRHKEAQEELQQLELMYSEEEFADKTKEIVIGRGKRRLERSERSLEIKQKEMAFLQSHAIPLETRELQLKLEQARHQLEEAQRKAESATLKEEISVLSAEAEIAKLEFELRNLNAGQQETTS